MNANMKLCEENEKLKKENKKLQSVVGMKNCIDNLNDLLFTKEKNVCSSSTVIDEEDYEHF